MKMGGGGASEEAKPKTKPQGVSIMAGLDELDDLCWLWNW